tara:strand:+ start:2766 stop:2951 length:186 start_codon:yes stop_codon:yes gene_type:complete
MDWELEQQNLRLQDMIIVYQEHIDILENEVQTLKQEVLFLKTQLENKTYGYPDQGFTHKNK